MRAGTGEKLRFESCLPQIVRPVLSQSKYKNLLPLFVARNILLVSPEAKVREMLRVLKGVPQVNLLGKSVPCVPICLGLLSIAGEGPPLCRAHADGAASAGLLSCPVKRGSGREKVCRSAPCFSASGR